MPICTLNDPIEARNCPFYCIGIGSIKQLCANYDNSPKCAYWKGSDTKPTPHKRTTRTEVLDSAKRCVCGDREQDYGSPENNFRRVASLWSTYLGYDTKHAIQPKDVAAMLALMKIARIASGHSKADNWIDLAGYAACGGELEGMDND